MGPLGVWEIIIISVLVWLWLCGRASQTSPGSRKRSSAIPASELLNKQGITLTCSVEGCGQKREARGLCRTHHLRWLRTGNLQGYDTNKPPADPIPASELLNKQGITLTCSVEGCGQKREARGLCRTHHLRWLRTGNLQGYDTNKPPADPIPASELLNRQGITLTCSVEGCGQKREARGLCRTHHLRWLRTGNLQGYDTNKPPADPIPASELLNRQGITLTCSVEGCGQKREARGLCRTCYLRWLRPGNALQGYGANRPPADPIPASELLNRQGITLTCSVEGCGQKREARGLCRTCYLRWLRPGNALQGYGANRPPTEGFKYAVLVVEAIRRLVDDRWVVRKSRDLGFLVQDQRCSEVISLREQKVIRVRVRDHPWLPVSVQEAEMAVSVVSGGSRLQLGSDACQSVESDGGRSVENAP